MVAKTLPIEAIVSDPSIRNGKPILAGTTIRVSDIVASHIFRMQTAEELAANFGLDLGQIHAALAYFYLHRDEIEAEVRDNEARANELLDRLDQDGKLIRFE
jgi:uncharacterized protein (DUF433 family)